MDCSDVVTDPAILSDDVNYTASSFGQHMASTDGGFRSRPEMYSLLSSRSFQRLVEIFQI